MNLRGTLTPMAGRILIALLFIYSGVGKVLAPSATLASIAAGGIPFPTLAYIGAVAVELGGGALIVAGWHSRLVAFVMAGFTLLTALIFHHDLGDQETLIHFLKNLSIAGGLLQIVVFGAGAFSIDEQKN